MKCGEKVLSGDEFISLVHRYFEFLVTEFDYKVLKKTNRKNLFYDVECQNNDSVISISYENRENYLQVIVFTIKDGVVSKYDDKELTQKLGELNRKILPLLNPADFEENESAFASILPRNETEKSLFKVAKELRLCMTNLNLIAHK